MWRWISLIFAVLGAAFGSIDVNVQSPGCHAYRLPLLANETPMNRAKFFSEELSKLISTIQSASNMIASIEDNNYYPYQTVKEFWRSALVEHTTYFAVLAELVAELNKTPLYLPNAALAEACRAFNLYEFRVRVVLFQAFSEVEKLGKLNDSLPKFIEVMEKHPGSPGYPLIRHLLMLVWENKAKKLPLLAEEMLAQEKLSTRKSNEMARQFFKKHRLPEWK